MAESVDKEIGGVKVSCTPLPFPSAQPLIPTIAQILALATSDLIGAVATGKIKKTDDLMDPAVMQAIAPALGSVFRFLDNGLLERLAPKILATTRVIVNGEWQELIKEKERVFVFETHPEIYFPTLYFAGRVTFARFFPVKGLLAGKTPPASP